jgi:uncharacterized protein (TIGR02246 family)
MKFMGGLQVRILISILTCLAIASFSTAQNAGDEQSVRKLVGRYAAARQSQDAKAIESLFTVDADQLVSSGEWRRGRDELVKGMLESSRANAGARTITVESVRFPIPVVGIANARYEIAGAPGAESRRMWSTFICIKQTGDWRIAAIRNMLPAK